MARITNNPFGSMSGSIGELTIKTNKYGKQYASAKPDMSRVKPSVVQKFQRSKMKVVMDFISPLSGLMKEAYMPFQKNMAGFDAAKSYYMKEALIHTEEGYAIDYHKALITFGDLRIPEGIQLSVDEAAEDLKIDLQWEDNTHQAMAYPDDLLSVIIYDTEDERFIYQRNLTTRDALQATISLLSPMKNKELQLWMAFVRPEEKRASASVYLGELG